MHYRGAKMMASRASQSFFLIFLVCSTLSHPAHAWSKAGHQPHVCIVGGGIAGASASHFLANHCRVTLFEARPRLGGRIAAISLAEDAKAEAGASVIAAENKLMLHFASILNLSHSRQYENCTGILGLWDGKSLRLKTTGYSLWDAVLILRRYGASLLRMRGHVRALLRKFDKLYDDADVGYYTVEQLLLRTPGLYGLTQKSFAEALTSSLGSLFVSEFVAGITRVNYNQEPEAMNGFAGMVAIAGSGGGLWSVEGGNVQIVEGLVNRSGARVHLDTRVNSISVSDYDKTSDSHLYTVSAMSNLDGKTFAVADCDAVILAAPIETADIDLHLGTMESAALAVNRTYVRTVATFVLGMLRADYFGLNSKFDVPDIILTTAHAQSPFSSIGRLPGGQVADSVRYYKLFSRRPLDDQTLQQLFEGGFTVLKAFDWLAYPEFNPPETFAKFAPAGDGHAFFYTAPIESAASAMEMSAISGRNAAALVRRMLQIGHTLGTIQADGAHHRDEL